MDARAGRGRTPPAPNPSQLTVPREVAVCQFDSECPSSQRRRFEECGVGPATDALWREIAPAYQAILEHPFVTGLTDGRLDEQAFRFYVVQDAHFLRGFARALSVAAAHAPEQADVAMLDQHAASALDVERSLHESFFVDFGLSDEAVVATPVAPTNLAYTSYVLAVAHDGSFPEALAALLPCYWIYREVGEHLLERGSPHPLYRRWIDTYGGDEYAAMVREMLDLTERVAVHVGSGDRERMARHARVTARYEWMFWDMALRGESWPALS